MEKFELDKSGKKSPVEFAAVGFFRAVTIMFWTAVLLGFLFGPLVLALTVNVAWGFLYCPFIVIGLLPVWRKA